MPPPPPVPPRKTSPLVWILIAIAAFVILGGVFVAVGTFFVARTLKSAAGNPAGVIRMIASMNPDVEVVSSDEATGKITIKDKKTGKTVTMNFDDVKNGKVVFEEEGSGTRAVIGGGSTRVPAWVPAYPGSSTQGKFSSSTDGQEAGQYTLKTSDSVDKVSGYYQETLKKDGYKIESMVAGGAGAFITARTDDAKRTVVVTIGSSSADGTSVLVAYTETK